MRSIRLAAGVVACAFSMNLVAPAANATEATGGGGCTRPAQVLDLKNWKITLPVDDPAQVGPQPLEIRQPRLKGYAVDPWFVPTAACDGVRFRSAVNGVTTPNSSYPRSELHEMTRAGTQHISWPPDSGSHTMVIDQTITHLPNDKPHVVAGQIHDGEDDVTVFRLEGQKLYVTNGDDPNYALIDENYVLGTRFQAKFEVRDGRIEASYNGVPKVTLPATFAGAYFKAGAYTQANCARSAPCEAGNFGEVIIHGLSVTHR
ncbi:polysaccharide lyase family 7 protein [Amycolatopsis magusensis]|uniref:polysaccharide lyase family 7 protein n=1 Tax=Amycolatopsis magusensis TaxID=882444 RepID=UPI0024A9D3A8|nr:polysaccharide lyase family 7 protein [Amycolatopsis magusensis]MDI5976861.1 polysaccharide lyase family 7 protein [Amycolatopsis magusensis]